MRCTRMIGLLLPLLLAGCVTPQTTKSPPRGVDLKQFKTVRLLVKDAVNTAYSKEGLPMFQGLLKGRLESRGFSVVETDAQMILEVNVHEFDFGSRTMRLLVGFGAGKAVLKYTATFRDQNGDLLAQMEGGKAYNGMEIVDNANFKSDEATRMGLLSYSVSQIAEFIEKNGAGVSAAKQITAGS